MKTANIDHESDLLSEAWRLRGGDCFVGRVLSHEQDVRGDGDGGGTMMETREGKWREGRRKKVEDRGKKEDETRGDENKHNRTMGRFRLLIKSWLIRK